MKIRLGILIFALIEIFIGLLTLVAVIASLIKDISSKPPEVLAFVLATACVSCGLGLGILRRNLTSYHLLLYFSSIIILSKILIFTHVIQLNGALETAIPSETKNIISIVYHALVLWYFTRKTIRKEFVK